MLRKVKRGGADRYAVATAIRTANRYAVATAIRTANRYAVATAIETHAVRLLEVR